MIYHLDAEQVTEECKEWVEFRGSGLSRLTTEQDQPWEKPPPARPPRPMVDSGYSMGSGLGLSGSFSGIMGGQHEQFLKMLQRLSLGRRS